MIRSGRAGPTGSAIGAVRPMDSGDVDAVHALAAACFAMPWDRQVFVEELTRERAHLWVLSPCSNAAIAAYVSFWLVRDEVHILGLATTPGMRRRGYARRLMLRVLGFARRARARYMTLEVRGGNEAALHLYRGLGFETIGLRPSYYTEDRADALVMLLSLERAHPAELAMGAPHPRALSDLGS